MALVTASVMLTFLLYLLKDGVSAEQISHHGQMVDDSGDPNDCIVCHDGIIASYARYCTSECSAVTSHSIFKDYPPRLKERYYAPVESLRVKGIRLFNGKVSCVSCHDLRQSAKYHLIMDNKGDALCLSCHKT